jgi:hypothetical protein
MNKIILMVVGVAMGTTGLLFSVLLIANHLNISNLPIRDHSEALQVRSNFAHAKLPLRFEENHGQTDSQVRFISRNRGYNLLLTPTEAILSLINQTTEKKQVSEFQTAVLRMQFLGANSSVKLRGIDELPGRSNYFNGKDPQNWQTNIPNFAAVFYQDLYPGVDLIYYGNKTELEYDLVVHPGGDPNKITIHFEGANKLEIDSVGNLLLKIDGYEVRKQKPFVYQETDGSRRVVACDYLLKGEKEVGFRVANYDPGRSLVIDPILNYSTYLGGNMAERVEGMAVDSDGNVYIAGLTASIDFPSRSPLQPARNGSFDAFVVKMNPEENVLLYSAFLSGSNNDGAKSIAVDPAGNAYVTGFTGSNDLPTTPGAFKPIKNSFDLDAFVAKLDPTGSMLIYSTYLGGSDDESGTGIAIDTEGNAYVTGYTDSLNFPTTLESYDQSFNGELDAFVTKLSQTGNALVYSTFLGGNSEENFSGGAIAVDSLGNAYVTGETASSNFPTANPVQANYNGGQGDIFIAKLNQRGSALVYSTFLGGANIEFRGSIAIDAAGCAYVTGATATASFPTVNPLQAVSGGGLDAFVVKLNENGNRLVYSTFLGGSGVDIGTSITIDPAGYIYVAGATSSVNFPLANSLQNTYNGGRCTGVPCADSFVVKLNPSNNQLSYSTYLGGSNNDWVNGIALAPDGGAYVAGETTSTNFPTANPLQANNAGRVDSFIAKIFAPDFMLITTPGSQTVEAGASTSFTINLKPMDGFNERVNLSTTFSSPEANGNLTATLSSASIMRGESATLTVSIDPEAPVRNYSVIIKGTAGQLTQTATLNVNVAIPDFALRFDLPQIAVARGQKGQIPVSISRLDGFVGNVTVTAPDTRSAKIRLTPPVQSTTGMSLSFNYKIKETATPGPQQLTFTGRDDSGHTHTGTIMLVIQ